MRKKDITKQNRYDAEKAAGIMSDLKTKTGRPSVINDDAIRKIEEAALLGLNNSSICLYANISQSAFYAYLKRHPEFKSRIDVLRQNNNILAVKNIVSGLTDSNKKEKYIMSRWYLEKTDPEYSTKQDISIDSTGSLSIESRSDALGAFLSRFESE